MVVFRYWCFVVERDSLWRKVIDSKYSTDMGNLCLGVVKVRYEVGLWKYIRYSCKQFVSYTRIEVGALKFCFGSITGLAREVSETSILSFQIC